MAPSELQRISLVMIAYGDLLLYECLSDVDQLTYGFLGSLALEDEQPRECAQRVWTEIVHHRSHTRIGTYHIPVCARIQSLPL